MAGRNEEWMNDEVEPYRSAAPLGSEPADASPRDPAEIRAEIAETRERVGDTLEAIGERLNPQHVKAQVRDNIRDATVGKVQAMASNAADRVNETRYTVMDTIRENPIPALMAGIGLGWLYVNGRRRNEIEARYAVLPYGDVRNAASSRNPAYSAYGYGTAYEDAQVEIVGATGAGSGAAMGGRARGGMGAGAETGLADRAGEKASEVGRNVRDTAGQLADRTQHLASDVADRAGDAASAVSQRTRRQARRAEQRYYEAPFAFGAAALALGLASGLALPVTDREVQLMGDARDRVVDKTLEAAQETKEKVQHVAERVIDETKSTGAQAAREEGLTG